MSAGTVITDPITYEHDLRCRADVAFDGYTHRMTDWWHPDDTADAATSEGDTVEPRVGGRVFATHGRDHRALSEEAAVDPPSAHPPVRLTVRDTTGRRWTWGGRF